MQRVVRDSDVSFNRRLFELVPSGPLPSQAQTKKGFFFSHIQKLHLWNCIVKFYSTMLCDSIWFFAPCMLSFYFPQSTQYYYSQISFDHLFLFWQLSLTDYTLLGPVNVTLSLNLNSFEFWWLFILLSALMCGRFQSIQYICTCFVALTIMSYKWSAQTPITLIKGRNTSVYPWADKGCFYIDNQSV